MEAEKPLKDSQQFTVIRSEQEKQVEAGVHPDDQVYNQKLHMMERESTFGSVNH